MRLKHLVRAAVLAAALCAPLAAHAAASPTQAVALANQPFEDAIGASKAAMMADPGIALKHARQALELARTGLADADQPIRVATAQWLQGEALLRLNRPEDARPLIDQALATVAARQPKTNLHGRLMMARGDLMGVTGHVQGALADFQAAFQIFGAANEPRGQAMALQNIGSIYQDAGDYERVLQYYAQSAEIYKADPALLVSAYNNTARALQEQGKLVEAIADFRRALAVAHEMDSPMLEVRILENLAFAEVRAGRLAAAEGHIAEGLRLADADPAASEWRPYLWGVTAQVAAKRGDLRTAAQLLDRTFQGTDLAATTLVYRDFHKTAYEVYDRLGDDSLALRHLKAFKRLDDEARTVTASTNAALMTARFDFANQESKIAKLKAGQLQKDIELAQSRNTIALILLTGSGALLCLLLFALLNIRRSRNQVRAANASLSEANASLEQAVKARTEFLATTSHEIRTPLNGILGMTQVLLADPRLTTAMREKIGVVHGAGETMLALVNDILDVAKIETGNLIISPVDMDLHALLGEASGLWKEPAAAKGVDLTVDFADAPQNFVADVTRLRQIVFNLMSNAIKFTEHGRVSLSVSVEAGPAGEMLAIRVSDTGIGIPADRLDDIFESFRQVDGGVTRKYGGTGLGLAICRQLASAMGGEVSVSSTLGKGSVFFARLPLRLGQPAARSHSLGGAPRAEGLEACAVLVVEPNPLAQSLLRAAMKDQVRGLEVVTCADEALAALARRRFDLILAEGSGLRGADSSPFIALARLAVAANGARMAVLWGEAGSEDRLLASGADLVVRKPVSTTDLLAELRHLCARPLASRVRAPERVRTRRAARANP